MKLLSLLRRTAAMMVMFLLAYLIASYVLFPSNRRTIVGFVKSFGPIQFDHARPKNALQIGSVATLPPLTAVHDAPRDLPRGRVFAVTAFDMACRNTGRAAGWLNDVTTALASEGVPHVIAGCGPSAKDFANFVRDKGLRAPAYFGACEQLAPAMKLEGGIRHYVLDSNRSVLDAWAGVPIYLYAERNLTAQIRRAATSR